MSITNIISAIGNTNSIYPLLIRDCGIEIPTKVALTYNQNVKESKEVAKLATRERLIDEYAVSAVWLGGIPLVDKIAKKLIGIGGYNSDINMKLLKEEEFQGIKYNIKKFGETAPEAVKDLIKVDGNNKTFQKLTAGKFAAATLIPMAIMGVVIPKLIFASSAKKISAQRKKDAQIAQASSSFVLNSTKKDAFNKLSLEKDKNVSFKGNMVSTLANFSTVQKMAAVDGGYAVGRVGTARNTNERMDIAFKMAGMMFLNFVAPKWIEKGLDGITGTALDPKMIADKAFLGKIKDGKLELPKSSSAKDLFEYIDNNPDSFFFKSAQKFRKIKVLDNGVRDPRAYVDVEKLGKFRDSIEQFAQKAVSAKDIEKFVKKAKGAKTFNILTNVALSSFLLAYCLPKAQFAFRKLVTGSDLEPGLAENKKS